MTECPDLNSENYIDYLVSQGEEVLDAGGVHWMKYHSALIPAAAMPVSVELSYDQAQQLLKTTDAIFIRYSTGPIKEKTDWWSIVCRHYDFNNLSPSTRSKTRRGSRRLIIEMVDSGRLNSEAYECHIKCYQRYRNAKPKSEKEFKSFVSSLTNQSIFDVWSCSKDDEMLGYIICLVEKDGVFMHTVDITPEGLHNYAAYAMINRILEYYVNEKGLAVSNGNRSISHATEMQNFLCKLGFEREYAKLHVIYRPEIRFIVNMLYPFRRILQKFRNISFVHKVSAVLFQEEILRKQTNSQLSP